MFDMMLIDKGWDTMSDSTYLEKRMQVLNQYLNQCIEEGEIPGASYAIITKDDASFGSLGYSQVNPTTQDMYENPIYDLASLTKVIGTVSGIMFLIEDGLLRLDTKVSDILDDFKHKNITIHHLITHTSGLPSLVPYYKTVDTVEEFWTKIYETDLKDKPGTKVVYSDLGFIVLGQVIKKFAGSLDGFLKKKLFEPLDMTSTMFCPSQSFIERCLPTEIKKDRGLIKGTAHDGNAHFLGGIAGHAGLFSTVNDLSNYMQMILNKGVFNDQRIFNEETLKLLRTNLTRELNGNRSLGWLVNQDLEFSDLASKDALYHTGFTGTSALIDHDFALILLTNKVNITRDNEMINKIRRDFNNIGVSVANGLKKESNARNLE